MFRISVNLKCNFIHTDNICKKLSKGLNITPKSNDCTIILQKVPYRNILEMKQQFISFQFIFQPVRL